MTVIDAPCDSPPAHPLPAPAAFACRTSGAVASRAAALCPDTRVLHASYLSRHLPPRSRVLRAPRSIDRSHPVGVRPLQTRMCTMGGIWDLSLRLRSDNASASHPSLVLLRYGKLTHLPAAHALRVAITVHRTVTIWLPSVRPLNSQLPPTHRACRSRGIIPGVLCAETRETV